MKCSVPMGDPAVGCWSQRFGRQVEGSGAQVLGEVWRAWTLMFTAVLGGRRYSLLCRERVWGCRLVVLGMKTMEP